MDTKQKIVTTVYIVIFFVIFTTYTFIKTFSIVYNALTGQDDVVSDQDHNYTWFGRFLVGIIFAIIILFTSS